MKKLRLKCTVHSVNPTGDKQLVQLLPVNDAGEPTGGVVGFVVDNETAADFVVGTEMSVEIGPAK